MELNREILDRFVDGELSPKEMAEIAEALVCHPDLSAYVAEQERLRSLMRARYRDLDETMPPRLIHATLTAPVSRRWRLRQFLSRRFLIWQFLQAGAMLAAGLALGVVLKPPSDFTVLQSGAVMASGALGHVLDTQLAAAVVDSGPAIGISFRDKAGEDCRTFSNGESVGLACHRGSAWAVDTLIRRNAEDTRATYHMAATDMPDALRRIVEGRITGAPFDAMRETRARSDGWRGARN
jgi:hypothetical protein